MRYINLVPQVTPKPPSVSKYKQYIETNTAYENTPERREFKKQYAKVYREEHSGYVECDCGSEVKGTSMYKHIKSKKHIDYIQNASS